MTSEMGTADLCRLLSAGVLKPGLPESKPEWLSAMRYVTELRQRSIFPAEPPMPYDWLDIGPGYVAGPAFGHIDLAHQLLDLVPDDPGMDHSIRFLNRPPEPVACVDACAHVHWCLGFAATWANRLGCDSDRFEAARAQVGPCRDYLGHNPLQAVARVWEGAETCRKNQ